MKGFQSFRKFKTKFEYDAGFNKLPKWDIKVKKAPKVKMDSDAPITFEYISQEGAKSVTDALDQNRKVSVKTPLSVRWTSDGKLNEDMTNGQLPYNLSTKEDDILKPVDIESTCIDSWDYDPSTLDLDVYFVSNPSKAYTFPGVPKSVVKRWILSPSKGQFYWRVIRRYSIA